MKHNLDENGYCLIGRAEDCDFYERCEKVYGDEPPFCEYYVWGNSYDDCTCRNKAVLKLAGIEEGE